MVDDTQLSPAVNRARAIHGRCVVADAHNDLLMSVVRRPPEAWGSFFRSHWLPQLQAGGVDVQVLPICISSPFAEGGLRETLRMIEAAHRIHEGNRDHVSLCRTGKDVTGALERGTMALVLALEGCGQVGDDVEIVGTFARLGIRMASLTHFGRNSLADGSGAEYAGGTLTCAGIAAIELMEELGMIVDVSHLGTRGIDHVLTLATRPIIASHSAAKAVFEHHRNLSDEHLSAIAEGGGVVCVNFYANYLDSSDHQVSRLLEHLEHIVETAGVDHVGLGPDFIRDVFEDTLPPCDRPVVVDGSNGERYIPGLDGPAGLPTLTAAMIERGFKEEEIEKILGRNLLRILS